MIEKKLPEGWEWRKLGDIGVYINGKAFKPSEWGDIGKPIVRIQNLTDTSKDFNYYNGDVDSKYLIDNGDILVSWSASLGVFLWNGGEAVLNQHIFKAIPNEEIVTKNFFTYALRTVIEGMKRYTHGSTMKHIVKSDFDNTIMPIPPLDIQHKIVAILEKAEATQRLRAEADALTQKFLQSVFLELFGDLMTNQMGWDILSIEQCLAKIIDYRGKTPHKEEKGIPLITAKLIKNGKISPPEEFISPSSYDEWMSRGLPQKGDVIFTTEGPLGEVAQIQTDDKIALAQRVLTLRGKSEMIDNTFLAHELRSEFIKRQLNRLSTGSTVKGIRQSEFRKIRLFVPPLKIQKRFVEIVKTIEKCQLLQQNQRSDVNYLYDSLMNKAFTGELIA